jgi:hypothetical protein
MLSIVPRGVGRESLDVVGSAKLGMLSEFGILSINTLLGLIQLISI